MFGVVWKAGPFISSPWAVRLEILRKSVSGAPQVRAGDEVVLFLARSSRDELHPVGLAQGVFYLGRHLENHQPVMRQLKAFQFINPQAKPFPKELKALKAAVLEVLQ